MKFLEEHLDEELFTQVQAALKDKGDEVKIVNLKSGEYISKAKFDAKFDEAKTLKEQLETRDGDIATLQTQLENVEGVDDLKADLKTLQEKYDGDIASHAEKIKLTKASLRAIQLGVNPKLTKAILAYVDLDKVTVGDDDNLLGFDEQVTPMKETHKSLFSGDPKFRSDPANPPPPPDPEDEDNLSDEAFMEKKMEERNK